MATTAAIYWAFLPGTFAGNEYAAICTAADHSEYRDDCMTVALYFADEATATAAWLRAERAGFQISAMSTLDDNGRDVQGFSIYVPEI